MIKVLTLSLLFILSAQIPTWALTAAASISATEVGVGETFQVQINVSETKKTSNLSWPKLGGDLSAFKVGKNSGVSSSSNTTIINGKITSVKKHVTQFVFLLTPKKAGNFTLGPITYEHGSFKRNFGFTKIKVIKIQPGLTLKSTLNKRVVYVGEQLKYNLRVILNANVQSIQFPVIKNIIGKKFWSKQMDDKIEARTEQINGKPTRVADIRFALFPLVHDNIQFDPLPIEYQESVRRRGGSRSFFDDAFFGGKVVERKGLSNRVSLTIKQLPPNAPEYFSGAVGQYKLSAKVNKTDLATGDALTLTIAINGNGQPKTINKPHLPKLSSFEIFDPEVKSNTKISGGQLLSSKTFKYVLVPHKKGVQTIEPITFNFFNPRTKTYETVQSKPFTINITQGKMVESTGARFLTQKDIESIGSDIRHIKKWQGVLKNKSSQLYKKPSYWLLYILSPLVFILLVIYQSRQQKFEGNSGLKRKSLAKGVAKKRLAEARKSLEGSDSKVFYKNLSLSIERYLSDQCNVEFRGLIESEVLRHLTEKKVPETLSQGYLQLMEECDRGQFTNQGQEKSQWNKAYQAAEKLINQLEKIL